MVYKQNKNGQKRQIKDKKRVVEQMKEEKERGRDKEIY